MKEKILEGVVGMSLFASFCLVGSFVSNLFPKEEKKPVQMSLHATILEEEFRHLTDDEQGQIVGDYEDRQPVQEEDQDFGRSGMQ